MFAHSMKFYTFVKNTFYARSHFICIFLIPWEISVDQDKLACDEAI